MINLEKEGACFYRDFRFGENRWNTAFVREPNATLDAVLNSTGSHACYSIGYGKFFSKSWTWDGSRIPRFSLPQEIEEFLLLSL